MPGARAQGATTEISAASWQGRSFASTPEALAFVSGRHAPKRIASPDEMTVLMSRHGFGRGEYRYFADPLPPLVAELRTEIYPHLVPIANGWEQRLETGRVHPGTLRELREECRAAGQLRPTPLLLRYGPDDYNCLHQDLYGAVVFPLQRCVLLSAPGRDFEGGEFLSNEQRPRMQSRCEVVPLEKGGALVFATRYRPVQGKRGTYRVNLKHGVSRIRRGGRSTLGIIFHDAI